MNYSLVTTRAMRRDPSPIKRLLDLSARIGRDPLLVQASGGNTSIKLNGTLWIKASGKWLANADKEEILVPVRLAECLRCLERGGHFPNAMKTYARGGCGLRSRRSCTPCFRNNA